MQSLTPFRPPDAPLGALRLTAARLCGLALTALVGASCARNPGSNPPPRLINFPTGVAVSREDVPRFLFVANSNFTAEFNQGSLQTFDLDVVAGLLGSCTQQAPCLFDPQTNDALMVSEVLVPSFASALVLGPAGRRLYSANRGEGTLIATDVDPDSGALSCGNNSTGERCRGRFMEVDESHADAQAGGLPTEPTGLAVGSLADFGFDAARGNYVVASHRGGEASLLVDRFRGEGSILELLDVFRGLTTDLESVTIALPSLRLWLPGSDEARVQLAGLAIDSALDSPLDGRLFEGGVLDLEGVDIGTRDDGYFRVARFDPRPERNRAYLLSRQPEAVLVIDLEDSGPRDLAVADIMPVGIGASRLEIAQLGERWVAFVSCFDSRDLYLIDVDLRQTLAVVRGLSGPFEIAVDAARQLVYVADFSVSTVRIVDTAPLEECLRGGQAPCSPQVIASLGRPRSFEQLR